MGFKIVKQLTQTSQGYEKLQDVLEKIARTTSK